MQSRTLNNLKFLGLALLLMPLLALADQPGDRPTESSDSRSGEVPNGLLPSWAVPRHYALDLKIDPGKSRFSGTTTIAVKLSQAADHVWLHGKKLKVTSVEVEPAAGETFNATWKAVDTKTGVARISFGRTVKPGRVHLTVRYSAPFNRQLEGLYKVSRDGRDYAMTQMEAISARYAFPGFDQPDFKTPYDIRITLPADQTAIANSAAEKTSQADDGWKTVTFQTTEPMPTYLVAFAVGPWDVVNGPDIAANKWRKQPVPLRGIAPDGEGSRMRQALEQTPAIVEYLENYYAFGYPFGKLDQLAAPDFAAGAMENIGLVTYRDWLMLLDADSPRRNVRGSFNVAAHELAHMWTGDTVTMRWWDDLWLNEAFATWMQKKITDHIHPDYQAGLGRVAGAEGAMSNDSLVSARRIRQPITGNGDIRTAFDGITYQKGAAVLAMFENYVGDKTFRSGMRGYIKKHKFANADADDLIDAVASAADKGAAFKQAFNSFLDQSGVPLVSTTLDCSGDKPVVQLEQSRYLPLGSSGNVERTWGIPVCVRSPAGSDCTMLNQSSDHLTLSGDRCPGWYMPNADARGYYRFAMPQKDFAALSDVVGDTLNDAEKLAWADAVDAGFHHGDFDAGRALMAMRVLASSKTADVAAAPLNTVGWIWNHELDSDAERDEIREQVSKAYLARLRQLGYTRRDRDTPEDVKLRNQLAGVLALTYELPQVRAALRQQADAVLKMDGETQDNDNARLNLDAANPDLVGTALAVAVQEHGKPTIDRLVMALENATAPEARNAVLDGLSHARGDQATRVRNLAISDTVKVGEMARLFDADRDTRAGRDALWQWFVDHYDAVYDRIGAFASRRVPKLAGGGGCSAEEADRLTKFFKPRLDELPGADRGLAQTSESIHLCAALKKARKSEQLKPANTQAERKRSSGMLGFTEDGAEQQRALEKKFDDALKADDLRGWMKCMASRPNQVGSPHNKANAEFMLKKFQEWGWDAHIETFNVLYPTPKSTAVQLLSPGHYDAKLREAPVAGDETSKLEGGLPPYNVFGADGDVTADLVYANYGMPDDYKALEQRDIDVTGKIVITRYGGGWRGLKPKLAQQHGAVACLIYSDPRDDGYFQGDTYPEGGWRPADGVQRGSVLDMQQYPGDPLTPGHGSTEEADRVALEDTETVLDIPVVPISRADATPLLKALKGPVAPRNGHGALPFTYHMGPGPAEVRVNVQSNWDRKPIYNVIAKMKGATAPDQWILRGNHHDGWVFGAWDPLAGNVAMMAEMKAIGKLVESGWQPKRTLVYASWDGEEPGLLGSTEWAETHADELKKKAVMYVNSDTNARGYLFAGGSHSLQHLVNSVASGVDDPEKEVSVGQRRRAAGLVQNQHSNDSDKIKRLLDNDLDVPIEALGSGSDYSAFLEHLGIASLNLGFGGEDDNAGIYHSRYDSFDHYTRFGDPDFEYGVALAQVAGHIMLRSASARVLPMRFDDFSATLDRYVDELNELVKSARRATQRQHDMLDMNAWRLTSDPTRPRNPPERLSDMPTIDLSPLETAAEKLGVSATEWRKARHAFVENGLKLPPEQLTRLNKQMATMEQALTDADGLPGRAWYRHMIYAPGLLTGYGVKTVPGVREALEARRWDEANQYAKLTAKVLDGYREQLDRLTAMLQADSV